MGGYSEECPHCGKWFTVRGAIKEHSRVKHPIIEGQLADEEQVQKESLLRQPNELHGRTGGGA